MRRRLCAIVATAAFVASSVAPTAALAREAVSAGLGDVDPASEQASSTRSATVAKSAAAALLRDLGVAPEGKAWRWVTDTAATTRAEDVWRTSDGQEFATEDQAREYAEGHQLSVTEATRDVDVWTVDGAQYDTEAAANAAADAARPEVTKGTRQVTYWRCSDGQEFATEDEARTHAASASVTYGASTRDVDVWTVDGAQYDTEAAANAAADAARPEVTSTTAPQAYWTTSDGLEFATEDEARAHAAESGAWDETLTGPMIVFSDGHVCLTNADALEYEKQQASAGNRVSYSVRDNYTHTFHHDEPYARSCRYGVVWRTSDGQEFSTAEEANAWRADHAVTYSRVNAGTATTWHVGDRSFSTEAEAEAYAATLTALTQGTREVTTWHTSDMHDFSTEQEADAWAAAHSVTYTSEVGQMRWYYSSDGQDFGDEAAAKQHCANAAWSVTELDTYWCDEDQKSFLDQDDAAEHFQQTGHGYIILRHFIASPQDGAGAQQFEDRDEAEAYARKMTPTWREGTRDIVTYRSSDGGCESRDEGVVKSYCQGKAVKVTSQTTPQSTWATSDGQVFDSHAEAEAHAATLAQDVTTASETVWRWRCSDGQEFATEQEATDHALEATPKVSRDVTAVPVWRCSDGQEFATEDEARTHADSLRVSVAQATRDVTTWHAAGSDYASEAEANAAADALRPQVSKGTRQVACWRTSDGHVFDEERLASDWAGSHQVTASSATRDVDVWTVDGTQYDTEGAANAAADAARPEVTKGTRQVTYWRCSDGQEFATEDQARAHVASTPIEVERGTRDVPVEETGHYELVDAAADAGAQDPDTGNGSGSSNDGTGAPADDNAPTGAQGPAAAEEDLPSTGAADVLPATVGMATMGAAALVASVRSRRRRDW